MFNEPFGLQKATFDGTKTMTRRVVPDKIMKDALAYQSHHIDEDRAYERYILDHAPYKVGEIVAIAQNYEQARPDMNEQQLEELTYADMKHLFYRKKKLPGFKNKMFVKAEWMPRHIKITNRKLERLQDISDEDCLKEGILQSDKYAMPFGIPLKEGVFFYYDTPREAYADLIDKMSGKGTWASNPLVFAYDYELVD